MLECQPGFLYADGRQQSEMLCVSLDRPAKQIVISLVVHGVAVGDAAIATRDARDNKVGIKVLCGVIEGLDVLQARFDKVEAALR